AKRLPKRAELLPAAGERSVQAALEGGGDRSDLEQAVGANRLALALDLELAERLQLGDVVDEPARELADDDLARVGRLLEPGGDADGLGGDDPLARGGLCSHRLAGLDSDACVEPDSLLGFEL